MADFDIIEDVTKAIPKGKDLKKLTPFIVGGLALGVITLMMNRRSGSASGVQSFEASDGVGQSTDIGGLMADFTNQTNEAIKKNNEALAEGVDSRLTTVIGNLYDVIEGQKEMIKDQNAVINQVKTDITQQLNDSKSTYNNSYNVQSTSNIPFNDVVTMVNKATEKGDVAEANRLQDLLFMDHVEKMKTSPLNNQKGVVFMVDYKNRSIPLVNEKFVDQKLKEGLVLLK